MSQLEKTAAGSGLRFSTKLRVVYWRRLAALAAFQQPTWSARKNTGILRKIDKEKI
jgi:hypothetical protein